MKSSSFTKQRSNDSWRRLLILSLLLFGLGATVTTQASTKEAHLLQERAIERIDRYIDHFRRTFDRGSMRGELAQAAAELEESVRLFRNAGADGDAAFSLVKLADLLRYNDKWDAAIRTYEDAAVLARESGAAGPECKALLGHARALMYGKQAPGPAYELVEQALRLAHEVDDRTYLFDAWDLLAQIQTGQGDLVGAADSMARAFAVKDAIQDKSLLYYAYLDRADIYQKFAEKCDYQKTFKSCLDAATRAHEDYERALGVARDLRWNGLAEQTQGFIQRLEIRKGMIEQQQRMHGMITESELFAPGDADDVVISKQFAAGENPALESMFALLEQEGGIPPATDARGAYIKGLLHEAEGDRDAALASYLLATDLLEDDQRSLYDERARGAFIEDRVEFYYTTILHLLDRRRYADAFELMERSRSRVMSDLLASREIAFSSPDEERLYAGMLELQGEIGRLQTCLFDARGNESPDPSCQSVAKRTSVADRRGAAPVTPQGGTTRVSIATLESSLDRLQSEYTSTRQRLVDASPRLARLVSAEPADLESLQKILERDKSEVVTYLTLESQVVVWHIGPDSVRVRSVFLPRSVLKDKIERLRSSLVDRERAFDERTAHELYLFLIAPVLRDVESDHLVIIPHEDLHYVPFQALHMGGRKGFLGEEFQISYTPSATVLASLAPPQSLEGTSVFAAADPSLTHAPDEARAVYDSVLGSVPEDALPMDLLPTESEVKAGVSGRPLVHLAVHGTFAAEEPLLSYLHLRDSDNDDGNLTAAEMYALPLDAARLVVLSACETGTVRASHANEVVGMMRGLLFAGADALLLSSWKIDDEATAKWMTAFYKSATTRSPAASARAAIIELRKDPKYQHPYYWSPFLLTSR